MEKRIVLNVQIKNNIKTDIRQIKFKVRIAT